MIYNTKLKKSLEIIADFMDCTHPLDNPDNLKINLKKIFKKYNITILKSTYYVFPNNGATILFLLSASHFALHTWPEKNLVNIDLFFCNYNEDNSKTVKAVYKELIELFGAKKTKRKFVERIT